jgi:hypothetical protein
VDAMHLVSASGEAEAVTAQVDRLQRVLEDREDGVEVVYRGVVEARNVSASSNGAVDGVGGMLALKTHRLSLMRIGRRLRTAH